MSYKITYEKRIPLSEKLKGVELYTSVKLKPSKTIQDIYRTGKVVNENGELKKISSAIGPYEGYHLYTLVKENNIHNVLEVGMANGLSAAYICQGLKDSSFDSKPKSLISLDPFQETQWENAGLTTIKNAKLKKYHKLIEEKSFLAMPKLVEKKVLFDMIFIDGMHLFDYTVLDLFYADQLVKIGGFIVLDDIRHKGTGKAYEYVLKNYKHWKLIFDTIASDTMATFVKIGEDNRSWDYHNNF